MILITGGTGTVGQELVRQLGDKDIIVFSRNEVKQVEMSHDFPNVRYVIGDVKEYKTLKDVCKGVDHIYHLAALKHVPVCEKQPREAIKTNVYGTMNVIKAAKCPITFMSTDKAEDPSCIYGHTKAIAEKLILQSGNMVIRSGNIFGSSGSVIPLFIKQVKEQNKITLTDGEMTRFFITVKDLVGFIIGSPYLSGSVLIPPCRSFSMQDIAEKIISIYGDFYTKIEYIGARNGEKKHEILSGISSLDFLGTENDLNKLFL